MSLFCGRKKDFISVVMIVYNMGREAPRTLHSLSTKYQQGIGAESYEIIVIDNGSTPPLGRETVEAYGPNFRYFYIDNPKPSPAEAVNFGASKARGDIICVMIDGARLVTPGMLLYALKAFRAYDNPVVGVPGWHLGSEPQQLAVTKGYSQSVEDGLLASIGWPHGDPYRLFEISCLALSSKDGCFVPLAEANAVFVRRKLYDRLGGFNNAFASPGGGLVNLDFYARATSQVGASTICLFGEGCFHQLHSGVASNIDMTALASRWNEWNEAPVQY